MKELLEWRADPNALTNVSLLFHKLFVTCFLMLVSDVSKWNLTPLHSACSNGFTDVAVYLLRQSYFYDPKDPVSTTYIQINRHRS